VSAWSKDATEAGNGLGVVGDVFEDGEANDRVERRGDAVVGELADIDGQDENAGATCEPLLQTNCESFLRLHRDDQFAVLSQSLGEGPGTGPSIEDTFSEVRLGALQEPRVVVPRVLHPAEDLFLIRRRMRSYGPLLRGHPRIVHLELAAFFTPTGATGLSP